MRRKTGIALMIILSSLFMQATPVFAGEWIQDEDDQWQYIQDDGTEATGWLEIDDETYYLDENGNRKEDYWLKDDGNWYYLDSDGVMATSQWVDNYYVNEDGELEKKR